MDIINVWVIKFSLTSLIGKEVWSHRPTQIINSHKKTEWSVARMLTNPNRVVLFSIVCIKYLFQSFFQCWYLYYIVRLYLIIRRIIHAYCMNNIPEFRKILLICLHNLLHISSKLQLIFKSIFKMSIYAGKTKCLSHN